MALADLPDPDAAVIDDETPAHIVVFIQRLLISETEVTQKVWLDVMGTKPGPEKNWQAKNWQQLPVVSISWHAANGFIDRLNKRSVNFHYRLPTEAEWEYAARAGSAGLRPFSKDEMGEYAWYINSSNDEVHPVAQLKANDWGLYDMYGNVWEWVSDWYSPTSYANSATTNPKGPAKGTKKVRRGGSYHCPPHLIRPAYRAADSLDKAYSVMGFRLVAEKK
jgi:formylglycine-generating enzyme required for sulfatase activity